MRLSEQSLSLFKELYIKEFGIQEEMTDGDYEQVARKLLGVYIAVYGKMDLQIQTSDQLPASIKE